MKRRGLHSRFAAIITAVLLFTSIMAISVTTFAEGDSAGISEEMLLAAPTISSLSNSSTGITVKWNQVENASGYYVYRINEESTYSLIGDVNSGSTVSYTDTTASVNGKRYKYKIVAYIVENGSTYKSPYSVPEVTYRLKSPSITVANAASGITVKWEKTSGVTGYQVYRSKDGSSYSLCKTIASASTVSYTDSGATDVGAKYQYKIRTYKKANEQNYYAACCSAKTIYKLESPTPTVTLTLSGLSVKWTKSPEVTGYQVWRSVDGGDYERVKTAISSYSDTSAVSVGTKYKYKIRAYKTVGSVNYYAAYSTAVAPSVNVLLNKTSLTLCKGKTSTLKPVTYPAGKNVVWTSSDKTIATVDAYGKVKAVAKGTATITAKVSSGTSYYTATCTVKVTNPSLTLDKETASLKKGSTLALTATTNPSGVTVTWSSSNTNIATVSSTGEVIGVKYGTATITAKFTYLNTVYSKTCKVTVKDIRTYSGNSADYVDKEIKLVSRAKVTVKATLKPNDPWDTLRVYDDYHTINYHIWGNDDNLTITKTLVYEEGTHTLTIDSDGPYIVTVTINYIPELSCTSLAMCAGRTKTIKLKGTNETATWTSSDSTVASVNSAGTVTTKKKGKATIACTLSNGQKLTCSVNVTDKVTAVCTLVKDVSIYNDCYVDFTNYTNKTVDYIDFQIYQYNYKGVKLSSPYSYFYYDKGINPDSKVEDWVYWVNDATKTVKLSIIEVRFTDGTKWRP